MNVTNTNSEMRARLAGQAGLRALDGALEPRRVPIKDPEPPTRSARVEAGLAAIEEAEQEREALRNALTAAETDLRGVRAEHEAMRLALAQALGENDRYQRTRDEAVDARAKADALLEAVLTLLQKHRGPSLSDDLRAARDEAFITD